MSSLHHWEWISSTLFIIKHGLGSSQQVNESIISFLLLLLKALLFNLIVTWLMENGMWLKTTKNDLNFFFCDKYNFPFPRDVIYLMNWAWNFDDGANLNQVWQFDTFIGNFSHQAWLTWFIINRIDTICWPRLLEH